MKTNSTSMSPGSCLFAVLALALFAFGYGAPVMLGSTVTKPQESWLTTPVALIIEVDARGNVTLNETPFGTVADPSKLSAQLQQIFAARLRNRVYADRDGATQTQIPLADRIAKRVFVHPDLAVSCTAFFRLLRDVRDSGATPLTVELHRGDVSYAANILPLALTLTDLHANPLLLSVTMDRNRHVFLNRESVASLTALTERLHAIFAQRASGGEFMPGTKEIYQAVELQIDQGLPTSALLDLMEAVGQSFASPIILRLDDPKPTKPVGARNRRQDRP